MIPSMNLVESDRPGFCQKCYCEKCGKGFYEKARYAVKYSDGRIRCNEDGGPIKMTPLFSWQRLSPCRHCGNAGLVLAKFDPIALGVS
jgi:hypothetical protein